MKAVKALLLAGCLSPFLRAQALPAPPPPRRYPAETERMLGPQNLSDAQKLAIMQRLMMTKEPFLQSYEARMMPSTLGSFFHEAEYQTLSGNPGVGYYHADPGFAWTTPSVAFVPFRAASASAKGIHPEAWEAAMKEIAERRGLTLDPNASVRILGACVFAHRPDAKFPRPEVSIEVVVQSPEGRVLFRRTDSRPTLGDACGAALDFVVAFAQRYGGMPGVR